MMIVEDICRKTADSPTAWTMPSTLGRVHDQEQDHFHHVKKLSVLAKVKEKARKWRQSLVKKRHGHDGNSTPSWGVALEDYEVEEDPEYLGAPTYESEHAPESCKGNARQHRGVAIPVISEKRDLDRNVSSHSNKKEKPPTLKKGTPEPALTKSLSDSQRANPYVPKMTSNETLQAKSFSDHQRGITPSKLTVETLVAQRNTNQQKEKLPCPEVATETVPGEDSAAAEEEKHPTEEKTAMQGDINESTAHEEKEKLLIPGKADQVRENPLSPEKTSEAQTAKTKNAKDEQENKPPTTKKTITEAMSEKLAPAYATVSEATQRITSKIQGLSIGSLQGTTGEERKWDKGVSVKEYIKSKLEPGEDERALSQVISEAISPRRTPSEKGVVEKVKEAVTLLLHTELPSTSSSSVMSSDSSPRIPVSTNAHEVEEENHGRVLQTN